MFLRGEGALFNPLSANGKYTDHWKFNLLRRQLGAPRPMHHGVA